MEESKANLDDIIRRLDVIICLLLKGDEEMTARQKISQLKEVGLGSAEIARILNKNPKYISKELSLIKKSSKKV